MHRFMPQPRPAMLVAMKDATKLKVATAVTVLFLAAISVAGLVNRGGDAGTAAAPAQSAQTVQATAEQPAARRRRPTRAEATRTRLRRTRTKAMRRTTIDGPGRRKPSTLGLTLRVAVVSA